MAREDDRRRGPGRGWRREGERWSSESARRSVRGDEDLDERTAPRTWRSRRAGGLGLRQDERGRYRMSGRCDDTGYGNEWPEDYRGEFSGQSPQGYRDAYSERQSGPYRSRLTGRPVPESDYRQETHWQRSRPHTGSPGRVSGPGYEDPTWAVPQMGRTGGARSRTDARSDEGIRGDIREGLSGDREVDARGDVEVNSAPDS